MRKRMVGIKKAANETGLSEWELRTGCWSGKYPHLRVGGQKGKILFDIELLQNHIRNMMLESIETDNRMNVGIRKVE